jgi:hypothetical protein
MTGGKNGSTPVQNLAHLRRKRVFEMTAEVERSKCPSHPTKRMWEDPVEAVREAEVRSTAAKMPIAAYRCDACGNAHLCKAENARPGSILTRPEPERNWEVFVKPGNADAKRKALREFLVDRDEATTDELIELLEVGRKSVGTYMQELKWHNTRGRHARWIPDAVEPPATEIAPLVQPRRHLEAIEGAKSRHPSTAQVGWEPMLMLDTIRHVPLGDVIDMLAAMGRELRIQTREKP